MRGRYGPNQAPKVTVTVSFDLGGSRAEKTFSDAYKARSFYARMDREGRNPALKAKRV